jgi:hypothetical protein
MRGHIQEESFDASTMKPSLHIKHKIRYCDHVRFVLARTVPVFVFYPGVPAG